MSVIKGCYVDIVWWDRSSIYTRRKVRTFRRVEVHVGDDFPASVIVRPKYGMNYIDGTSVGLLYDKRLATYHSWENLIVPEGFAPVIRESLLWVHILPVEKAAAIVLGVDGYDNLSPNRWLRASRS
jgi:hypothetical protein